MEVLLAVLLFSGFSWLRFSNQSSTLQMSRKPQYEIRHSDHIPGGGAGAQGMKSEIQKGTRPQSARLKQKRRLDWRSSDRTRTSSVHQTFAVGIIKHKEMVKYKLFVEE